MPILPSPPTQRKRNLHQLHAPAPDADQPGPNDLLPDPDKRQCLHRAREPHFRGGHLVARAHRRAMCAAALLRREGAVQDPSGDGRAAAYDYSAGVGGGGEASKDCWGGRGRVGNAIRWWRGRGVG